MERKTKDSAGPPETQKAPVPDYLQVEWPEQGVLDLKVEQDGVEVKLHIYRYPVPERVIRKGVVFYVHGLGSYCERIAFIFKGFAEQGYEVFALDQRGFGNSGGHRGLFENSNQVYSDIFLFVLKTIEKFRIDL